jgi:hypothetical protein
MSTTNLLADCRRLGITLTPALDYDGPDGVLDAALEARIRERKFELIRALVGPAGADVRDGPSGPDWRFEWLREFGIVFLRGRDAQDPQVKALLRELLAETPRTLGEWLTLGTLIREAEFDLRRAGKLPPIPNFRP